MERKSHFIEAFLEKVAANPMGWLKPVTRVKAIQRLNKSKAQAMGTWDKVKATANSPAMKARKAVGLATIGGGAALYGAHKLTTDPDDEVRMPHHHYGVGQ